MKRTRRFLLLLSSVLPFMVVQVGGGLAATFNPTGLNSMAPVDVAQLATFADRLNLKLESRREAELAAIAVRPAKIRTLFWLLFCEDELGDGNDDTHQVLHVFFALAGGNYAPEVKEALSEAGFTQRAQVFAGAMALFGQPYPRDDHVRYKRYGWATPSKDFNAFDDELIALGDTFGTRADLKAAINGYIERDNDLSKWCDISRDALTDRDRLVDLVTRVDAFDGSREPAVFLKWPEPYRTLQILEVGFLALQNGGAEQFFINVSGDTAPEAAAAYRIIGMPKAAAALDQGIGFFARPYPRHRTERLDAEQRDPKLSDKLDALTDTINDGTTTQKMIEYAKRENVLPH